MPSMRQLMPFGIIVAFGLGVGGIMGLFFYTEMVNHSLMGASPKYGTNTGSSTGEQEALWLAFGDCNCN